MGGARLRFGRRRGQRRGEGLSRCRTSQTTPQASGGLFVQEIRRKTHPGPSTLFEVWLHAGVRDEASVQKSALNVQLPRVGQSTLSHASPTELAVPDPSRGDGPQRISVELSNRFRHNPASHLSTGEGDVMQGPPRPTEAQRLFLSALPVVDEVVDLICCRRRCREDEVEEFVSFVRLRLIEKDCAVLRQFSGRSSLKAYLSVVIQRLFLDLRRQRWGVWRPSAEARRLGGTAVQLEILVCRDALPLEQAIETLQTNKGVRETATELRDLAARLRARPRRIDSRPATAEPSVSAEDSVERLALANERHERARNLRAALHEVLLPLPPEDALALRLRFVEGFTVARVAEILGVPVKPLYRRIERRLADLAHSLRQRGFSAAELPELLGDLAFEDDAEGAVGKATRGPSDKTWERGGDGVQSRGEPGP